MTISTLQSTTARAETAARILDAAFDRISLVGLAGTTVEDVARAAGISRQTVYRYFSSKDHLLAALVMREEEKFLDGARTAFAKSTDLPEALYEAILFCLRFAHEHPLLDRLLETDPEALLPYLTTRGAPLITRGREAMLRLLRTKAWVRLDRLETVADLVVRGMVSYAITPSHRPAKEVARHLSEIVTLALTGKQANTR
jgi:AcrR family transcriptional regulator